MLDSTSNLGGTVYNTNTATYTSASGGDKIKLTGQDPVFTASDAAITFAGGNVLIDTSGSASSPSTLTVNNSGSGITFAAINGTDADIIVLNAGTDSDGTAAKVTVGAITAGTPEIKSVTITGNDGVTLNGSISTSDDSGAAVSITGPITLGGDITIDTNVTTNDGTITLGTVDSTDNGQALTIDSGAGNVSIGVIGGTAQLDGLTINTAGAAGDDGDITLAGIGDGTPTYGVVGTVDVGNSRTELLKFTGTSYDIDTGTATFEAKAGAGTIEIDNASAVEFITDGTDITFDTGSIKLSGGSSTKITTGTGAGVVQIDGAIDSNTSTAENLTIISGTGNLVVDGAIGANVNLGTIDINSGTADGDGDVTVAAIGASGSSGATGAIAIGNTATDVLTLDGQIYESASTQTYTAKTGAFSILLKPGDGTNDTVAFTTNAGNIKFATGDVELYGDTTHTIDTGAGGGTVIFDGDIQSGDDGDNDILVIKSGDGAVTITGHIGNTKELGGLLINDAVAAQLAKMELLPLATPLEMVELVL